MGSVYSDTTSVGGGFGGAIPFGVPYGGGFGSGDGGLLGAAVLLGLVGNGGFGRGRDNGDGCCDHDHSDNNNPYIAAILSNLNNIATAIPTTALETQGTINNAIGSLALGIQQGLSSVKDSVQSAATANLLATNAVANQVGVTALQTVIAIGNDGDKTRAQGQEIKDLINSVNTQNLNRELAVAEARLARRETDSRMREVEVNVSQTVNQQQVQAQAQLQQQQQAQFLAGILAEVRNLAGDIQAVKQGQVIFNSGAMTASGTQAAANTKVA
jgi:hypothetical protein